MEQIYQIILIGCTTLKHLEFEIVNNYIHRDYLAYTFMSENFVFSWAGIMLCLVFLFVNCFVGTLVTTKTTDINIHWIMVKLRQ